MGKQNTGSWKDKQGAIYVEPVGWWLPVARHADGTESGKVACRACWGERKADCDAITSEIPGADWQHLHPGNPAEGELDCTVCGRDLSDFVPLQCPTCGYVGCFSIRVFAWTHIGPDLASAVQ